jgi:hypothetical protein
VQKEKKMPAQGAKFSLGNDPAVSRDKNPRWHLDEAGTEDPSYTARIWFPEPFPVSTKPHVQAWITKIHSGGGPARGEPDVELEVQDATTEEYFVVTVTRHGGGVVNWIDVAWTGII